MNALKQVYTILVLIFLLPQINTNSQELADSTSLWIVDTEDGNSFMGSIVDQDSTTLILLTDVYGPVHIPLSQIKNKKELKQTELVEGEHWFSNPHATRYFFGTNG